MHRPSTSSPPDSFASWTLALNPLKLILSFSLTTDSTLPSALLLVAKMVLRAVTAAASAVLLQLAPRRAEFASGSEICCTGRLLRRLPRRLSTPSELEDNRAGFGGVAGEAAAAPAAAVARVVGEETLPVSSDATIAQCDIFLPSLGPSCRMAAVRHSQLHDTAAEPTTSGRATQLAKDPHTQLLLALV